MADIQADNYSRLHNKLVAEGFYLTGNIEKYGSGFIRIRKALRDYPEIEFEINPDSSLEPNLFLPPCRGKVRMGVESLNSSISTPSLALPLQGGGDKEPNGLSGIKEFAGGVMATFARQEGSSGGVNGLLAYIQTHPGQRASEMATAFDISRRTIERWLKQLKDNQLIEYRGAPKTGGYYPKSQQENYQI